MPRHWLGAPLSRRDREDVVEGLLEFFGSAREVNQYYVRSVERITNKSVGLLQADSIFAALALFLTDRPRFGELSVFALVLLMSGVCLLCSNLVLTSWSMSRKTINDEQLLGVGADKVMARAIRFTLALYLSGAAFVLVVLQVLLEAVFGR